MVVFDFVMAWGNVPFIELYFYPFRALDTYFDSSARIVEFLEHYRTENKHGSAGMNNLIHNKRKVQSYNIISKKTSKVVSDNPK